MSPGQSDSHRHQPGVFRFTLEGELLRLYRIYDTDGTLAGEMDFPLSIDESVADGCAEQLYRHVKANAHAVRRAKMKLVRDAQPGVSVGCVHPLESGVPLPPLGLVGARDLRTVKT